MYMIDKFFKKTKGSISIFLVLIMLPMFTCAGLIVDGARISAARTSVTGAGDLAMNAALSEYDQVLKDVYGLFAMSSSTEELEENVSRYFSNTINNEGVLQGSDSYTRTFINSIGSMFSSGDVSFDNIVDTEVQDFSLVEVSNSALGNPTVLDRQIVEFMKYRGPVSLGTGLLTKLGCIGETSKQTKALEAKVDYEKKLDSVQEACETAYNAVNAFNNHLGSTKFTGDYLTTLTNDLNTAKDRTKDMAMHIMAKESPSYALEGLSEVSDLKRDVNSAISSYTGEDKNLYAYELTKEKLYPHLAFDVADGVYTVKTTTFTEAVSYFGFGPGSSLEHSEIEYINTLNYDMDGFNEMFTYLKLFIDRYGRLTDEQKSERANEYNAYINYYNRLIAIVPVATVNIPPLWKERATTNGKDASKALYEWYADIGELETKLTDAIDALDAVLAKESELTSARTTWSNKVNDLSDSDIKSSMQADYSNSAKDINNASITALKTVLENNKTHFSQIKQKLESVKFYNKKICIAEYDSTNYFNRYSSSIPEHDLGDYNDLSSKADSIMSNYVNADVRSGLNPASFTKITDEQQFYKFLKTMCTTSTTETTAETEAKNNREALMNKGNESTDADTTGIETGSYITGGLTSEISDAIAALGNGTDAGANSFDPTAMDPSGDDDSMADSGKANLSEVSNLLSSLGDIAETARDYVYLEEYFTEMFSCYTTGKNSGSTLSLNGTDMSTNKFFGSEMEYILYGKDTVESNLNCAKATIFGIRFALNSIYALTSSNTRTPALTAATAIAGWTGFGVPIVQTVILLAWALAESMMDLKYLCEGKAVALYKSNKTWVLDIDGLPKAIRNEADVVIDDVFTKIENTAMDSIDSINTTVTNYVNETTQGLVESIQGKVMLAIENLAMQIVGESNYDLTEEQVGSKVDALLNSLTTSSTGGGASAEATRKAVEAIKTTVISDASTASSMTIRDYLVSSIYSAFTEAKAGALDAISTKVGSILDTVQAKITSVINNAVSSVGESLKTEVSNIISQGGDQVKEKVTTAIDGYLGDLGGATGGGGGTASASGFALTYKEYIKTFMLIGIIANKDSMLERCAELIQLNVSEASPEFDITKAFTMVEVNSTVSIGTTFFDVPITSGVDATGNPTYDLDFSQIGSGRQEVKYVGIIGY